MQKLAEICIRRPVFATMLITALVVVGTFAYLQLGVDLFPKVDFPNVTVTTVLRGASPEEIETEVTKKIEEAVNTIGGIDEMRSVSTEGISQVFITFILERDIEQAAQDVRDKVSGILRELPKDIDPPVIEKLDPDAAPIMSIAVSAGRSAREITEIADKKIKQPIESLNGVGQVRFIGDRKRQIHIWVDAQKLQAYNLTIPQIEQALVAQNIEVPGGRIDEGRRELVLRTLGRVAKAEDFNRIILANVNGMPIRVSNVGHAEDGVEEPRTLARLDGKDAVLLEVRKQSGTNTVEIVQRVKRRLAEIQRLLPDDFRVQVLRDQSVFINNSFHAIQEHLILGGLLAAMVVLFFMRNLRSALIAAVAIPTSIISTFGLMWYMGFTLNNMTMLALVLCVGIVIDDAIVVLENIFRFIEEKKVSPMQAAKEATAEIGLAVMATTFSLMIIFLPVAFMSGIVGRFMKSFGLTAAFAIGVSLVVSFTLTPMLCARFLRPVGKGHTSRESWIYSMVDRAYVALLDWSMSHRAMTAIFSLLVVASIVPLFQAIGKDFIPQDDQSQFEVTVRAPEGLSLSATDELMRRVEEDVRKIPEVATLLTTIGGRRPTACEPERRLRSIEGPGPKKGESARDNGAGAARVAQIQGFAHYDRAGRRYRRRRSGQCGRAVFGGRAGSEQADRIFQQDHRGCEEYSRRRRRGHLA
ncbi:MAG: efflux RND transporter permease subunit [Acidobacteria bacterium]|nr:efflux RND transporter permease subunit [Acidobacteriota bacterium]MBI3655173.1 efflux RND transporter permease subunit [Acidobacteriota bacterium]